VLRGCRSTFCSRVVSVRESVVALVHYDGRVTVAGPSDPIFIGTDAPCALAAWHALELALPECFVPEQSFRYAIDAAIAAVPELGGPAQVLEAPA
jgi:hypothetical protein